MNCEQVKNWLKTVTDCGEGITLGGIEADRAYCLGVVARADGQGGRLCVGGAANTRCRALGLSLLVHWGPDAAAAEAKARELWATFDTLTDTDMDGTQVLFADPGEEPSFQNRDGRGICEFKLEPTLWYATGAAQP